MGTVNIKINGVSYTANQGITVLEAVREAGIDIPTLCYLRGVSEIGACRICLVEIKGQRGLVAACVSPVADGMEITTTSPRIMDARKKNLELILSTHNKKCLSCVRSGQCELQDLSQIYGVEDEDRYAGAIPESEIDQTAGHMYRDNSKCILCRRCTVVCSQDQDVGVIGANERGFKTYIGSAFDQGLGETACVGCGQCIVVCPTGALSEKDHSGEVWAALSDETKHVVVQPAPAIRFTAGEAFGMPVGSNVKGKMVAALRRLGFDAVFDTEFGADLTIMEEANEFVERIKNGGVLPIITSCSPSWVKYAEHNFPEMLPNLSTCKSPHQMFGAIVKTWYAQKNGIDAKNIVVVSVMPCTAKKLEKERDDQNAAGVPDVDIVLTTREFANMVKKAGIDFVGLPDENFDDPLGQATGAGTIFGATGGVMEASLRTASEWIAGEELKSVDFHEVRGTKGIKEATYKIGDLDVNVAVASGLANAHQLLEKVKSGEKDYHFIEIMACKGGCVNGGGQPIQPASVYNFVDLRGERAKTVYRQDADTPLRKSHENPSIKKLYSDFLGKPGSHKAHELLHTSYKPRSKHGWD
ncbi:MAG: NADH-dependent [FeFe] hydrogenase, group A6 [Oscillospiraceae bacterium]|nr:NADH-dependent [FeFe] hydrogenase, group A6 [Oscillospiraceae bacterium]